MRLKAERDDLLRDRADLLAGCKVLLQALRHEPPYYVSEDTNAAAYDLQAIVARVEGSA